jgi:hypothetical protein
MTLKEMYNSEGFIYWKEDRCRVTIHYLLFRKMGKQNEQKERF